MSFLKKKITSLIPTDTARGALQNVLTVEWGNHKTVLVEVPQAGSSRSNEVEMAGMSSRDYNNYGRLGDDDEDERAYLTRPEEREEQVVTNRTRDRSQSQSTYTQKALPKTPTLPPRPQSTRMQSNNPFNSSAFEYEEYSKPAQYNQAYLRESPFNSNQGREMGGDVTGNGHGHGRKRIASLGEWETWDQYGTHSPTSSSRTGTTTSSNDEDPFR